MSHYATPRDQWPTRQEANEEPPTGPALLPDDRAALVAELAALQAPITRCDQWSCRTTVDIDDDPRALADCGHVICDRCVTCEECA